MFGNVLLGLVSVCTIISYLPQTIKLIKTKKSDDLSINSWILWELECSKIEKNFLRIG